MLFDYIKYLLLGVSWQIHGCLLTEAPCVKATQQHTDQTDDMDTKTQPCTDFWRNLVKLLVSISQPFYPQQQVSCVVVGRFCLVLMVVVKGRWLCSDETRCSPCSIDLFTNSWRKPESASSHGEMNNKWLFTSFFSCKVITESPFTDVIQHFPCFLTLLTVCLEMSLPNNNFLVMSTLQLWWPLWQKKKKNVGYKTGTYDTARQFWL